MLGGYSIAVRNNWSFKTKRIHITSAEKELYLETFGNKIILENKFIEWWIEINNLNPTNQLKNINPKN